jgi:elongation factor G
MSGSSQKHPMYLTLSAVDVADDERLRTVLAGFAGEGFVASISVEPEKAYRLSGNSVSYLESICDRLRDECQCAINVSPIKVVLLETIRRQAKAEGKYIRQTGGSGNYGHCKLRIEPNEPGKGYEFVNDIKGDVVPNEFIKSIDQGVQGALELGVLAGFPIVDVKVILYDGSYHEADSNKMAFEFAGSIAFKEAARKAHPVLLEPVMAVEIEVPEELGAAILREVHGHRGRIERQRIVDGFSEIEATVPLSELLGSASTGLGHFPMEFAGYEAVSDHGPSTDNGIGVTANRPNYPKPKRRSDAAPIEHEDE